MDAHSHLEMIIQEIIYEHGGFIKSVNLVSQVYGRLSTTFSKDIITEEMFKELTEINLVEKLNQMVTDKKLGEIEYSDMNLAYRIKSVYYNPEITKDVRIVQ
ncbi:hypothetical protein EVB32_155 [Rhizobium phage RHph_TM39]|uniref:Uncharacterized protein n=1 Tax=Rhizobium phage RHph_TM30 TaxID=2509764 RepID=A0A7S5R557_9CAUD|nr:hypothetical protein PQC16_gp155 [Rhizobium phage RHph_TM30]QIG71624.1 hypothetical protein EVB94_153 [Rhizobium phage RHph_TM40]QIG71988.1 hypothetical protein EVB95_154 [Rhizobium phage RHph_TM2_3B]QIG72351.1 hypothetical protein EVB96_155 [Rhizobium phage RHph_TM3_3_6]QIG77143.1 hypothetical protein EVB32_155 [Rhizobium phage RHph_TM39]QIG77476.1 hypothetical protein EVB61_148 [Rhizobium phage RHph_TM21B]QIG77739.1 hypothetical protein EVB64_152 [Rhizobium phage RHph_TM61]